MSFRSSLTGQTRKEAIVKISKVMAKEKDLSTIFVGSQASVDYSAKKIFLPEQTAQTMANDAVYKDMSGLAAHFEARIAYSQYGRLRSIHDKRIAAVADLLEGIRCEAVAGERYVGSQQLIEDAYNSHAAEMDDSNFMTALSVQGRRELCGMNIPSKPDFTAQIEKHAPGALRLLKAAQSTEDIVALAKRIVEQLDESEQPNPDDENQNSDAKNGGGDGKSGEQRREKSSENEGGGGKGSSKGEKGGEPQKEAPEKGETNDGKGDELEEGNGDKLPPDHEGNGGKKTDGDGGEGKKDGGKENGDGEGGADGDAEDVDASEDPEDSEEDEDGSSEKAGDAQGRSQTDRGGMGHNKSAPLDVTKIDAFKDAIKMSEEALNAAAQNSLGEEYTILTREFDHIIVAPEGSIEKFHQMSKELGPLNTYRQKMVMAFKTITAARWQQNLRDGRVNNRRIATLKTGNTAIFKQKRESKAIDTAVTMLVDCSGSMSGSKIRIAFQSVIMVLETLSTSNIKCEVLGFTTDSSYEFSRFASETMKREGKWREYSRAEPVKHIVVKAFDEPYGPTIRRRIAGYGSINLRNNADYDALLWAAERLIRRKEERKVLIVLSDGAPACAGDHAEQCNGLKNLIREIRTKTPIELLALGIEHNVSRYYGSELSVYIPSAASVPKVISTQLRKILGVPM